MPNGKSNPKMRDRRPGGSHKILDVLSRQRFFVFDLEYTAWPGSQERRWSRPGEHREVVQIGAVAVDPQDDWREVSAFQCLVKPTVNPVLSDYIIELTGIKQSAVDTHGLTFGDALSTFAAFIGELSLPVVSFGMDVDVLLENGRLTGTAMPFDHRRMGDIRQELCELLNLDEATAESGRLRQELGLSDNARRHDGLEDARSIATAIRHAMNAEIKYSAATIASQRIHDA